MACPRGYQLSRYRGTGRPVQPAGRRPDPSRVVRPASPTDGHDRYNACRRTGADLARRSGRSGTSHEPGDLTFVAFAPVALPGGRGPAGRLAPFAEPRPGRLWNDRPRAGSARRPDSRANPSADLPDPDRGRVRALVARFQGPSARRDPVPFEGRRREATHPTASPERMQGPRCRGQRPRPSRASTVSPPRWIEARQAGSVRRVTRARGRNSIGLRSLVVAAFLATLQRTPWKGLTSCQPRRIRVSRAGSLCPPRPYAARPVRPRGPRTRTRPTWERSCSS